MELVSDQGKRCTRFVTPDLELFELSLNFPPSPPQVQDSIRAYHPRYQIVANTVESALERLKWKHQTNNTFNERVDGPFCVLQELHPRPSKQCYNQMRRRQLLAVPVRTWHESCQVLRPHRPFPVPSTVGTDSRQSASFLGRPARCFAH